MIKLGTLDGSRGLQEATARERIEFLQKEEHAIRYLAWRRLAWQRRVRDRARHAAQSAQSLTELWVGLSNRLPIRVGLSNRLPIWVGLSNRLPIRVGLSNRLPIWVGLSNRLPIWVGLHAARLLESEGSMIKLEPDKKSQFWLEYGETDRNWEKIQKRIQNHPFNHAVRSVK